MDELLLEGSRGEQSVEISAEELGNKVAAGGVSESARKRDGYTDMSSRGEMKTSLKLMIYGRWLDTGDGGRERGDVHSRAVCA